MTSRKFDLDELVKPPEAEDAPEEGYETWKEAKIREAIAEADAHPDDVLSHDEVFGPIKAKFRP